MTDEPDVVVQPAPVGWREARLDLLVAEELAVNPDFADRFVRDALSRAGRPPPDELPQHVGVEFNVWHQVDDGSSGENDLDATLRWPDGSERRVLIEDKVWAPLQARQAERYRSRAETAGAAAVLVAPRRWMDTNRTAAELFHDSHSIEDLASWLRAFTGDDSHRNRLR
jgi:hypothetical protein